MKTTSPEQPESAAIVQALDLHGGDAGASPETENAELARACAFAEPLLRGHALDSGEDAFAHAQEAVRVAIAILNGEDPACGENGCLVAGRVATPETVGGLDNLWSRDFSGS